MTYRVTLRHHHLLLGMPDSDDYRVFWSFNMESAVRTLRRDEIQLRSHGLPRDLDHNKTHNALK